MTFSTKTTWRTLVAGAQTDVRLRVMGLGGNGVTSPSLTHLAAEFR